MALDGSPHRTMKCSVEGCSGAWYETVVWDSTGTGSWVLANHSRAVRRAVQRGWTGDGSTGCLCANRDIRCPDHRLDTTSGHA